ncbi:hemerythrin domain-containing protein [Shewanella surugensis]|uniref:Hemerythrin domain-containing protein n=1 Tax=Shewanella surugensis TaxID=212020 RepID=A0ABT0LAN8_9GAMM|nr:hemerythrin domain-containing protein [Shewanella surugensis]MCL1124629.1 hemerythrin domain-containing protein [Shewanella surugensis]
MHALLKELYDYHHDASKVIDELSVLLNHLKQATSPLVDSQAVFHLLSVLHSDEERQHHQNEELIRKQLVAREIPLHPRIQDLENDHNGFDRIADHLKLLVDSELSHKEISAIIDDYILKYYDHIDGEENIFFPMADKYLSDLDWQEIKNQWQS